MSRVHVDFGNAGPSYIIGFGDYTDGDLWVQDDSVSELECVWQTVTVKPLGPSSLPVGTQLKGRTIGC